MLEIRHAPPGTRGTRRAYNRLYRDQGILLRDSFYIWLIQLLRPRPGRSLLDISCGQGRLVLLARERGLAAYGVDFAVEALKAASADSGFALGDGQRIPIAADCVDYVTHIGSLEHYEDPAQGAREITRILRPGGKGCILLPNAFGLLGNIRSVWSTGEIHDDGQPLQRYATRHTWSRLLTDAGLSIDRVLGYGEVEFPRTVRDAGWLAGNPRKLLRWLASWLIPTNLANHFVFIVSPIQ